MTSCIKCGRENEYNDDVNNPLVVLYSRRYTFPLQGCEITVPTLAFGCCCTAAAREARTKAVRLGCGEDDTVILGLENPNDVAARITRQLRLEGVSG